MSRVLIYCDTWQGKRELRKAVQSFLCVEEIMSQCNGTKYY